MNGNLGLIGRKISCTRLFNEAGRQVPVTVVEAGPCTVVGKRTADKDGYVALRLTFGEKKAHRVNRPDGGQFKQADVSPGLLIREFRVSEADAGRFEVGQKIGVADLFQPGDRVDVTGRSKGRGFAGVIKRHRFKSFVASHGTHEHFRHSGSIGQNMNPGRVFPGLRMPGHMGDVRVTQIGLRVAGIDAEHDIVLINGSVPGFRTAFITVRLSNRKAPASSPATPTAAGAGSKKK